MKKRIFSTALACALALALLTSCGGGGSSSGSGGASSSGSGSISGSASSSGSDSESSSTDGSDQSQPDGSLPGGSSSTPDGSQPGQSNPDQSMLQLNRTDFSLFKVGATFQLKTAGVPSGTALTWSSSDDSIATVSKNGTVTYVAPGSATIAATVGDQTVSCKVYCKPEASSEKPGDGSENTGDGSENTGDGSAAANVDLSAFYTATTSSHTFANLQLADKQIMDAFYAGLSDISTEQCLAYVNQLSINTGEFALIQVKDSKDVDAVKAILQARIDAMVDGGAWYPEPTALWTNSSTVVSNGNYVMMVVNKDYKAIVSEFNALF